MRHLPCIGDEAASATPDLPSGLSQAPGEAIGQPGLTKREYFASQVFAALTGFLEFPCDGDEVEDHVMRLSHERALPGLAVKLADALIVALNENRPG